MAGSENSGQSGRKRVTLRGLSTFGGASFHAGIHAWETAFNLNAKYLRMMADGAMKVAESNAAVQDLLPDCARRYVNYLGEMALVPGLALDHLRAGLEDRPAEPGDDGNADTAATGTYDINGCTVMLPFRVSDARQGVAIYSVSLDAVAKILDDLDVPYRPFRFGQDKTFLSIFIVDYRVTDFGSYHELGIGFSVVPNDGKWAAPGLFIVTQPLNQKFPFDAGIQIWGYPKVLAENLELTYPNESARLTVDKTADSALSITIPRGGRASSTKIPFYSYTVKDDKPHTTVFTRSGTRERVRMGGAVKVELGTKGEPGCLCATSGGETESSCVCEMLSTLGLPSSPLVHSWTEHMTGEFSAPGPIHPTATKPGKTKAS